MTLLGATWYHFAKGRHDVTTLRLLAIHNDQILQFMGLFFQNALVEYRHEYIDNQRLLVSVNTHFCVCDIMWLYYVMALCYIMMLWHHKNLWFILLNWSISENRPCRIHRCPTDTNLPNTECSSPGIWIVNTYNCWWGQDRADISRCVKVGILSYPVFYR